MPRTALMRPAALLRSFRQGLFLSEERCAFCFSPFLPPPAAPSEPLPTVCPACRAALPRREGGCCVLCGEPFAASGSGPMFCAVCLKETPPWQAFRFYGIYEGLLRRVILRTKFRADIPAARALGLLLLPVCRELPPCDALVPMPQHPSRLRLRGQNQCLEMARPLAGGLGLPLLPRLLIRSLPTRRQTGLRREERKADLSASFAASAEARGRRILLVDDAMTTGTTLRHAVLCLLRAGASTVCAAVAARTALR